MILWPNMHDRMQKKKLTVFYNAFILRKNQWKSISNHFSGSFCSSYRSTTETFDLREHLFTAEEEALLDDVLSVLKPLKIATLFVSGESQPTASRILSTLAKLNQQMTCKGDTELSCADEKKDYNQSG